MKPTEPMPETLVRFTQEGSVDSVTALKLIMEIEETFGIVVEDEEIRPENFATLSGLLRFIETKLGR
ncbi:MAG: phosphopantetheine-binding protein [Chloroflexota bacterium]